MAKYCPTRLDSLSDRSYSLGCDERNKYHCLRNKKDEMVEKCFEVSWIQKGDCAVYDTDAQTIDAWPCNINRGECPSRDYLSNDVMSYSACIPFSRTTNSSDGNPHGNSPNEVESKSANLKLIIPSIIVPLVLIIIIAIIILIWILQIRKRGNTNRDDENTVPLMEGDNPSKKDEKEEQKYKHLEKEKEHLKYFECKGECPKRMLETIKKYLQNQTNVLIIGKPGSGKTTLAWTLCKQMHGEIFEGQIWYVKASTSTNDLPDREEMTLIILLDGRFEDAVITEEMVKKVLDEVEAQRNKLSRKQMRTIVTISHEAYQRISKFELIGKLNLMGIINLDNRTNTLTNAEMTKVLETYDISVKQVKGAQESKVLSQKQLHAIYECFNHHSWLEKKVFKIPNIGFPLVAALMSLNPNFLGNIDFVQEPIRHVLESIDQLRLSTNRTARNKYCTLVYASFQGGKVDTNHLNQDLLTKIGNQHDHPEVEIDPDHYILRKRTSTVYEFLHDSLLRAVFAAYGSRYLGFVVNHCPLQILLEYSVSSRENISRKERMFYLSIGGPAFETALIRRIRDEKADVRHHRFWDKKSSGKDIHANV